MTIHIPTRTYIEYLSTHFDLNFFLIDDRKRTIFMPRNCVCWKVALCTHFYHNIQKNTMVHTISDITTKTIQSRWSTEWNNDTPVISDHLVRNVFFLEKSHT